MKICGKSWKFIFFMKILKIHEFSGIFMIIMKFHEQIKFLKIYDIHENL